MVRKIGSAIGCPWQTVGFDGFKIEVDTNGNSVTKTAQNKTLFRECVNTGNPMRTAAFWAALIEKLITFGAQKFHKSVEETYASIVADVVQHNRIATY